MERVSKMEDCPTQDYTSGVSNGKCWGDGHYECFNCIHYRADFKKHGQQLIDFAHQIQSFQIVTFKNKTMKVNCLEKNPAVEKHYSEMTKEQRLAELDSCIESIEKILDNYLKERDKILKG